MKESEPQQTKYEPVPDTRYFTKANFYSLKKDQDSAQLPVLVDPTHIKPNSRDDLSPLNATG